MVDGVVDGVVEGAVVLMPTVLAVDDVGAPAMLVVADRAAVVLLEDPGDPPTTPADVVVEVVLLSAGSLGLALGAMPRLPRGPSS